MLTELEMNKRAVQAALNTLEKALKPNSGNVTYFGNELVDEELTSANDIFEDFTEKFYEISGRVDDLLEPPLPAPASPMRQRSTSTSGSVLNNAMYKVRDTTSYDMVHARVGGLLAILKNQISMLKDHREAMSATRPEVEMLHQEQQRFRGLVDTELWMLYTALA